MSIFNKIDPKNNQLLQTKVKSFILNEFGLQSLDAKEFNLPIETEPEVPAAVSQMGTAVYSNLVILPGKYTSLDDEEIVFEGLSIDTALFVVTQTKKIVKTQVQGRTGSIKELISEGDYSISIKGAIVNMLLDEYPAVEVRQLIEVCKVPSSIKIVSSFLEFFGIDEIVIETYSLPQQAGYKNVQLFDLKTVSDTPIELVI